MNDISSTSNYASTQWNHTDKSVYFPYGDTLNFPEDLIDPSQCPENKLHVVIQKLKDPLAFFNALSADQKKVLEKLPLDLQVQIISEKESLDRFNLLSLEAKTAVFPHLEASLQNSAFEQWHTVTPSTSNLASPTENTPVNPESIALINSLSQDQKSALFDKHFSEGQRRAYLQNEEIFRSLSKEAQIATLKKIINFELSKDCSTPELSGNTVVLIESLEEDQLLDLAKAAPRDNEHKFITALNSSIQAYIAENFPGRYLEYVDEGTFASTMSILLKESSEPLNTFFLALPVKNQPKALQFFKVLSRENQDTLFKMAIDSQKFDVFQLKLGFKISYVINFARDYSLEDSKLVFAALEGADKATYFRSLADTVKAEIYKELDHAQRAALALDIDTISKVNAHVATEVIRDSLSLPKANKEKTLVFNTLTKEQQIDVYKTLSVQERLFLNLNVEKVIELTKEYTAQEKKDILALFRRGTHQQSETSYYAIKDRAAYYASLTDQERKEIFNLLDNTQQAFLRSFIFKDTLAGNYFSGKTPFTLEGANQFLNEVAYKKTDKDLEYDFYLGANSPQITAFNENKKCSLQQVANGVCTLSKLSLAHVHCEESGDKGWVYHAVPLTQLEKGKPANCKVTLTGPEGEFAQSFTFPSDAGKFITFSQGMPGLKVNTTGIGSFQELSYQNLKEVANGEGASFASRFNAATLMQNKAFGLFDPEHKYPGYFDGKTIKNSELKAEGKTLAALCTESVNKEGSESSCEYKVLNSESGSLFQRVTHIAEKTGETVLGASNPTTITNWANAFKKIGASYESAESQTLTIAGTQKAKTPEAPSSSWLPKTGSAQRASDLALFNILPGLAALAAVHQCYKFIDNAMKQPKKTMGQKVAGSLVAGAAGIAAAALAYNRFSQINLGLA